MLTYDTPIPILKFPFKKDDAWKTTSNAGGTYQGNMIAAAYYTETYDTTVDKAGTVKTPFATFQALRVATLLTQDRPRSFSQRLKLLLVGTRHHQWMYDGRSLLRLLESEGFASATVLEPGESRIEDPQDLNLRERSSESVYLEAIKP